MTPATVWHGFYCGSVLDLHLSRIQDVVGCSAFRKKMGYLDAQSGDADRTAFRRAEKRYKLYKHSCTSARSKKHRESVPPTDLSEVLDFRTIKSTGFTLESGIRKIDDCLECSVFTIEKHPGFYFIPEVLGVPEQIHWIKESLTTYLQPPNRTNHSALYGAISDLWIRAQSGEMIEQPGETINAAPSMPCHRAFHAAATAQPMGQTVVVSMETTVSGNEANAHNLRKNSSQDVENADFDVKRDSHGREQNHLTFVPMKILLRKLRWATLGLQFDWSKRAYDLSLPYNKIPQELYELSGKLARPAMTDFQFHAEAAIVNFFGRDDMLGGHLDDMEKDWSKPIVSISLGCKAIFLLGGPSREEDPTALFLRSGDVILMAGPARGCFHGVPRIFVDPKESDLPDFNTCDPSEHAYVDYIQTSRINLNIRQVF